MKLYVAPKLKEGGGVNAVMAAHAEYLKKRGVQYTDNESQADLVIVHALAQTKRRPDVFHSHGFYPTAQVGWSGRYTQANNQIIQTMMDARSVVSVSELAAEVMRRDFHIQPNLIRNGVNFHDIRHGGKSSGYILWPKTDLNPTCDPNPFLRLAEMRPELRLASMINLSSAIKSFGKMPRKVFLSMLRDCAIYLGTTRENCSMGTMEAMATGIPVVGYDWGFNREWLQNEVGCVLVEPGNLDALSDAIDKVLHNWKFYSVLASGFAETFFGWDKPIQQIYDLYTSLLEPEPKPEVSVIIPLHNYAQWIGEAVQSVKDQTLQPCEIIVVNDASTDNPQIPNGVRVIHFDKNQGVAIARNIGIQQAKGNIILCLDADDVLMPDYLQRAIPRFQRPRTGIVYGSLALTDEVGRFIGKRWFDAPFYYHGQTIGQNRVPTCALFRKVAWERAGGYRKYETPAEDAGLWTRIASQGWMVEFINDKRTVLKYRMHDNSLSRLNKFPDWVSGREWKQRNSGVGNPIQIYDCPKVSFIMRYSIREELAFMRTVDSIEGLKAIEWEICATGSPTPQVAMGFPFVRWNQEPKSATSVFLEAGDLVNENEWKYILMQAEFPA